MSNQHSPANPHLEEPVINLGAGNISGASPIDSQRFPLRELIGGLCIVGPPGSGKTQAVMHLLRQLWLDHRIPFMVVGPLHGEYDEIPGLETETILRHPGPESSTAFLFFDKPPDEMFLSEDDELPLYLPVVLDIGAMGEAEAGIYLHSLVHALCIHLDEGADVHACNQPPRHVLVLEQASLNPYLIPHDLNGLASYGCAVIMVDQEHRPIHSQAFALNPLFAVL